MTVGSAGNDTKVSPQNYAGVPPKQEQAGEFKAALNNATTSTGATPSSKGTEQSQDTSKSFPIILANRPPVNLGNQIGQQGAPSSSGTAPAAAPPPAAAPAPAAATKTVPGTSTPVPKDAVVDEKTKEATVKSGDFTVKVKPDRKADKGEDVRPDGAVTRGGIKWSTQTRTENGKVTSVTVKKELNVQTTYGSKADPAADSAYGRGHIKTDKDAGNGSLRFHEGNHGQDFIEYVKTHPYPTLKIDTPVTQQEFDKKMVEFKKQTEQYQKDMEAHSKEHTDDVTDPPAATTPAAAK